MSDDHTGFLLEDINHKLGAILEGEDSLAVISRNVKSIDQRLSHVESDVKIIKKTVTDQKS